MSSQKLPVLVVGGGPVGLVSAISLIRNGVPVRIIEKRETFHGGIRGTGVTPRTLEALSFLGIGQDVLKISTDALYSALYGPDGRTARITPWSQPAGESQHFPYPNSRVASQAEHEALLRDHFGRLGVEVEMGRELSSLSQEADQVIAHIARSSDSAKTSEGDEEMVECAYVIAADGAKGRTRKLLGIPFLGQTREEDRIFSGSVNVEGLDKDHWHMWGNMGSKAISLKPMHSGKLFQVQALGHDLPAELPTDVEGIRKLFYEITGRDDIQILDTEWVSEWRANIRMCQKFGDKRIFLAGDSAHCHSPFGGQGMNSGIQDAVNLTWKLALVYHGHASPDLLHTYTEERVPVIAEMLNLSSNIHYLAFGKPVSSTLEGSVGGTMSLRKREVDTAEVMHRPKALLQLGVNYRWSPIVLETRANISGEASNSDPYGQETDRLRAGDRAPDAPMSLISTDGSLEDTTLHAQFDMRHHVILVFVQEQESLARLEEGLDSIQSHVGQDLVSVRAVLPQGTDVSTVAPTLGSKSYRLMIDKDSEAKRVYDLEVADGKTTYVVVRPDGVVGAFAEDAAGVVRYFEMLKAGGRM